MHTVFFKTPVGIAQICGDEYGVSEVIILDEAKVSSAIPRILKEAVNQILEYFGGSRTDFTFKTNPTGTEFQKKVWAELQNIPFGKTLTYLELSKKMGDPKAVRAVASANGRNPLWIVVPCHRVIGSDGSLTGYAGGLWRKQWLLEHEKPTTQQLLF